MKTCKGCGEPKLLSEFYSHPRMTDGHLNWCKSCSTKRSYRQWKARIEADPEKLKVHQAKTREAQERYRRSEKGQAARKAYYKRRWAEKEDEQRAQFRRWHLKTKYGITPEQYDEMLAAQGGVCAICGGGPANSREKFLAIDHCHATGEIRGLLCGKCNTGIGNFKHDGELLAAAIAYIKR